MKPAQAAGNPLLGGPILPTLLRLAAPNVLAMMMVVVVGVAETYYIGRLGTTPLAAMALVFPFNMLTGMMSGGAMGGGVSSAISRALGASDAARAQALAKHAMVIGSLLGAVYSLIFLVFGPALYRVLGGHGAVLEEAVRYSSVLFCGAIFVWLSNTLASILRGTGNMRAPSATMMGTAVLQIVLGGALGLGLGPVPSLGIAGVALGSIIASAAGVAIFLWFLMTGRARVTLRFRAIPMHGEMFWDILKVGAVACLSPVQSILTSVIFTGLVARLGVATLAGYGIGQRLEFMLIPIAFGIGVAAVPMVGMAIGAGDVSRARRVAWTAGAVSAFNLAAIGVVLAAVPDLWASIFSQDEAVLESARQYLRWAGIAFAPLGLGLTLYFASQGAGKVLGPVLASTARLILVAIVGAWLAARGAPAWQYFALVAAAMCVYGLGTSAAVRFTSWRPRAPR